MSKKKLSQQDWIESYIDIELHRLKSRWKGKLTEDKKRELQLIDRLLFDPKGAPYNLPVIENGSGLWRWLNPSMYNRVSEHSKFNSETGEWDKYENEIAFYFDTFVNKQSYPDLSEYNLFDMQPAEADVPELYAHVLWKYKEWLEDEMRPTSDRVGGSMDDGSVETDGHKKAQTEKMNVTTAALVCYYTNQIVTEGNAKDIAAKMCGTKSGKNMINIYRKVVDNTSRVGDRGTKQRNANWLKQLVKVKEHLQTDLHHKVDSDIAKFRGNTPD